MNNTVLCLQIFWTLIWIRLNSSLQRGCRRWGVLLSPVLLTPPPSSSNRRDQPIATEDDIKTAIIYIAVKTQQEDSTESMKSHNDSTVTIKPQTDFASEALPPSLTGWFKPHQT